MSESIAPSRMVDFRSAESSALPLQRFVLAALVVVAAFAVGGGVIDRFALLRATLTAAAVIVLLASSVVAADKRGAFFIPASLGLLAAGAFAVALALSTIASDFPVRSLVGPYGRYSGLAMYVFCVAVFAYMLRCHERSSIERMPTVFVVVLALLVSYGLLQFLGLDPVDWPQPEGDGATDLPTMPTEFVTFGNVNFAAGFVATCSPFALWASTSRRGWLRALGVGTLVGAVVYLALVGSAQGPVALIAGCAVVGGAWLANQRKAGDAAGRVRRKLVVAVVLTTVLVVMVGSSLAQSVSRELSDAGSRERVHLWETAIDLWERSPLIGNGPGSFAWQFTPNRPAAHAEQNNFLEADAPHNVVLDMAVSGGAVVAGTYLVFVVYVGFVLFRGLVRLRGPDRMLLAAFGGAWIGYQTQSMVSIDVPPLALMHWLLAGAVVALAVPTQFVSIQLPGRTPTKNDRAARRRASVGGQRAGSLGVVAVVALVAMVLVWVSWTPLRADRAALRAQQARSAGDPGEMLEHAEQATTTAPWEARYWVQRAAALDALGDIRGARIAGIEAARRAPGSAFYALAIAGLSERLGDEKGVDRWLDEALKRDPHNPRVIEAVTETRNASSGT